MSAPGGDEKLLELKVGAVILVALALLVTFVLVLGDFSFRSRKGVEVFFQNPGGLSPGAAVKVAGRKVGVITEMTFLGQNGPVDPTTKKKALMRTRIEIDDEVFAALRRDARFYITTKGMLGDPFLEIDPGASAQAVDPRTPFFGVDPPRLDLFMADAYRMVNSLTGLLDRNAENLDTLLGGGARLMGAINKAVDGGTEVARLDRIMEGVESLVNETRGLVNGAKEKYVDDPGVARTLDNLEQISNQVNGDIGPLLKDVRQALATVDRLGNSIGPDEQAKIKHALAKLDEVATRADTTLSDVQGLVDRIRKGQGTVGQLMADEEIYDDLKELLRDLKHNPWKLMWKD